MVVVTDAVVVVVSRSDPIVAGANVSGGRTTDDTDEVSGEEAVVGSGTESVGALCVVTTMLTSSALSPLPKQALNITTAIVRVNDVTPIRVEVLDMGHGCYVSRATPTRGRQVLR